MMTCAVEVRSLRRDFAHRTVLSEVSFTVEAGERIGVVGPNGSGKSTLLRCLAGTVEPTAGTVRIEGHPPRSLAARRTMGAALGERALFGRLSGRDNLLFVARFRLPAGEVGRAVAALEDELDLSAYVTRRAESFSSGQRARVTLARALIGEPQVLLLDEPTRSLDESATNLLETAVARRPALACVIASPRAADLRSCDRLVELPERP